MSLVKRKLIRSEVYEGITLQARFMGPDLLSYADGIELASFYLDAQSAIDAGRRYVDAEIKAAKEREAKAAKEREAKKDRA
jgi:hypothetical protein